MKKLLSILVIGVVALALPMSVDAARITGNCEKSTCEDGTCLSICTVNVTDNTSSLNSFSGTFSFTPADQGEIIKIEAGSGWELVSGETSADIVLTADTAITASSFTLVTVTLRVDSDVQGCKLSLSNITLGNETPTDVEITVETTTSVSTGDTLPIVILACGVGACAVIYVVTKKGKKIYKI